MAEDKSAEEKPATSKHELSEEEILLKIYESTRRTERWIRTQTIVGFLKVLIFVAPIVFAFIYLPPLIRDFASQFQESLKQYQPAPYSGTLQN